MTVSIDFALEEEIGDPTFFVGRQQEMADLLAWAEESKKKMSKSGDRAHGPRSDSGRVRQATDPSNHIVSNVQPGLSLNP